MRTPLLLAGIVPMLWGCGDTAGPDRGGRVTVRFRADATAGTSASAAPNSAAFGRVTAEAPITVTGTNGTLVIDDIRLIVGEIELEREDENCEDAENDEGCEEFEGGPFLVNLLDGSASAVVTHLVPPGTYSEFEFEVENPDPDDDDDGAERQALQTILAQLRQVYPQFPSGASMVAHGTFTPTSGTAQTFTVYFDAEIEVEKELPGGFRVPEDVEILVDLNPAMWFKQGSSVMNLAALNGRTIEFEAQFKSGVKVEFDD